jgi:LysM repeat protein
MNSKRILQSAVAVAVVAATFATTGSVHAWSSWTCDSFATVQFGDTLESLAIACGTTVDAIKAANPGLGNRIWAGKLIYIPTGTGARTHANPYPPQYPPQYNPQYPQYPQYPQQGGGGTYVVGWGDTLGGIAMRYGVSLRDMLAANPQIWNASLIYPGQVIYLPAHANYPTYANYAPSYYPPQNYPPVNDPPAYNPTPYYAPTPYPLATDFPNFGVVKVTYKLGLIVRTGPGLNYPEIRSPIVSAVKGSSWHWRKDSKTMASNGMLFVEVSLGHVVDGYSSGWILVKDALGNYFTDPNLDP